MTIILADIELLTPSWASKRLPPGVEIVRIDGRWHMLLWSTEHVVSHPDPEKWLYRSGGLGASQELERWTPPVTHVLDLILGIAERARKAAAEADGKDADDA